MKTPSSGLAGPWARLTAVSALALILAASLPPSLAVAQDAGAVTTTPVLSLDEALRRSVRVDPALAPTEARRQASQASMRQADVRPNPALGVMVENFPTIGGGDLFRRTETTLSVEQRFERGGDRQARVSLAQAEGLLVDATARIKQLDRLEQVQRAWAEALAAQAELEIARERLDLAERFQTEVDRRVDMARDPLFAGARAEAELAQAQIDFDQAGIAVRVANISLARFWDGAADFTLGGETFADTRSALVVADGVAQADLDIFVAQRDIAIARVAVETARARSDATISAGVRHFGDGNDLGFVIGGSIPLGRYDQNLGAIDRARAEGLAAEGDLAAARIEREREIARLQVQVMARASEARRIGEETLPQAERAIVLVRDGFNRGGFTYNDVISAQTALLQTRARRVAVLKQFHIDRARLDRLTGAHGDLILALETQP
ncbi:TolC family protein [Brevundimonas sp.]|uniref:TolC family protein n=1 Tax=Brevundimonas sp. TaxID=1871086 RepID=UPI003B0045D8